MTVRIESIDERMAVRFLDKSARELACFDFHSGIINFTLSLDQNRLAVLLSDIKEAIRGFRLQEILPLIRSNFHAPPDVAFSGNDSPLAVANERETEIILFNLGLQKRPPFKLPTPLLALETGGRENELLTRSVKEVFRLSFNPPEILEHSISIELTFGD